MKHASALLLALAVTAGPAIAQTPLSPVALVTNGATYDGKTVTVAGAAENVVHKTSKRGNTYTTFDLCAGSSCIHVFEFGTVAIAGGVTTVTGTFSVEKHVGSSVYHNELDVESGN
jgi:hypothetical protein